MKRFIAVAVLALLCIALPTPAYARYGVKRYLKKETTVDMNAMNHVCVGWVDLGADQWGRLEYDTKTEWSGTIDSLNNAFVSGLPAMYLPGRTVVGAKNKEDVSMTGCDLYIKFSDVFVDYDHYHLILGIHFVDPKTGTEIGTIPVRPYFGDEWGLRGYLDAALKEVSTKLTVEITGAMPPKPKK
jgi:hypothetical protein